MEGVVEYDGGAVQEWHRDARQIRVAAGVTVIPERAFQEYEDLRAVDLSNVATISADAFGGCVSLERVDWSAASAVEIGRWAFAGCVRLEEIDLRNVTKIGVQAFLNCNALTRATIPSSVATIEAHAFEHCTDLAEVKLSDGIQRIGGGAFLHCEALARVNIPASVTDIGEMAFSGCCSLEEVELNEGLQVIGPNTFRDCKSLLHIIIPSTMLQVKNYAFAGCHQLRSAELREGLQMIGEGVFSRCNSLERVTIPSSVKSVEFEAFEQCTSLTEVTLSEGAICIGDRAFDGCTSLERITIPPVALVIDFERSSCQLLRGAMPVPTEVEGKLVVSKWLQYRSPGQLEEAEAKVNEILGRPRSAEENKIQCIRKWSAYYDRLDVATLLELAIWRINMNGNERDADARLASRRDFSDIGAYVLEYLEG